MNTIFHNAILTLAFMVFTARSINTTSVTVNFYSDNCSTLIGSISLPVRTGPGLESGFPDTSSDPICKGQCTTLPPYPNGDVKFVKIEHTTTQDTIPLSLGVECTFYNDKCKPDPGAADPTPQHEYTGALYPIVSEDVCEPMVFNKTIGNGSMVCKPAPNSTSIFCPDNDSHHTVTLGPGVTQTSLTPPVSTTSRLGGAITISSATR